MKQTIVIILSVLCCYPGLKAQERLKMAMDRYDYGTAVHVIDSLMAIENADSVGLALQKARCLKKLYRADEAAVVLASVLHLDQHNIELLAELAECHSQSGKTLEALSLYSILSVMQPENIFFKLCRARILYREKRYGDNIALCNEITRTDTIPEILSMTGDSYKNLGKLDSALFYYNHVLKIRPDHVATMSKKADILLSVKRCKPVIEMSRKYLEHDPDNMIMLPIYGLALHLDGNYPLSLKTFEHQRALGDDSYAVNYYIGLNHYMMDNWPRAITEFEKAYQIDSSDVTLVYQMAHAISYMPQLTGLHAEELHPESERLYEKAMKMLEPDPSMLHNIYGSMAMARHRASRFKEAIRYYELSFKFNPKNISALSSIGYCYERLKEYGKALEYYERYLKSGKPGTSGYRFVEESIEYVKQEMFMENAL